MRFPTLVSAVFLIAIPACSGHGPRGDDDSVVGDDDGGDDDGSSSDGGSTVPDGDQGTPDGGGNATTRTVCATGGEYATITAALAAASAGDVKDQCAGT
jgi:hypothetical protein